MSITIGANNKVEQAKEKGQIEFNRLRLEKLSTTFFPKEHYHPDFKFVLHKLMHFNSASQMRINFATWKQMCYFDREFLMPEMEICLKMLECATPSEIVEDFESKDPLGVLREYNDVEYPKIIDIIRPMREVYLNIDKQISQPIANKINAEIKMALQLPIGTTISFVALPFHG